MGSAPDEFTELRRLLALKRAEQPPPGYFNTFAGKVIARIEAEGLARRQPWWSRWFRPTAWSPGMAGANSAVLAGLALIGGGAWYVHQRPDRSPAGSETAGRLRPAPVTPDATDSDSIASVATPAMPATPQFAGFVPRELSAPANPRLALAEAPLGQFRIRQPSVRDRIPPTSTDQIPPGIFDPWDTRRPAATGRALPTSIVHYVESPAP